MKKIIIRAISAGLIASFIISVLHVYYCNIRIPALVKEFVLQNYVHIPNRYIIESFDSLIPSILGSVFFVFSAGVTISVFSLFSFIMISKIFTHKKQILMIYTGFWVFITIILNTVSFSIVLMAYTIIIPFCVVLPLVPLAHPIVEIKKKIIVKILVFTISFVAVGSIFYTQAGSNTFLRTRDYLLLSNKPGIIINNFYYKYSPYAVYALNGSQSGLVTYSPKPPNSFQNNNISFKFICIIGIFFWLPLLLYLFFFSGIYLLFSKFITHYKACFFTGFVSFVSSILFLYYLVPFSINQDESEIKTFLFSTCYKTRVEGLRLICSKKLDIWDYPESVESLINGSIAERYWLANVLALKKKPKSRAYLELMTEDESINVQCSAIRALVSLECSEESLQIFKNKIKSSNYWYVQQIAFQAYKKCQF